MINKKMYTQLTLVTLFLLFSLSCSKKNEVNLEGYWKLIERQEKGKAVSLDGKVEILHFSPTEIREYRTGMKDFGNTVKYKIDGEDVVYTLFNTEFRNHFTLQGDKLSLTLISIEANGNTGESKTSTDTTQIYQKIDEKEATGMVSNDKSKQSPSSSSSSDGGTPPPPMKDVCVLQCNSSSWVWKLVVDCQNSKSTCSEKRRVDQSCSGELPGKTLEGSCN